MNTASLDFSWVQDIEDLGRLDEDWQSLATYCGADAYLEPAWGLTWWDHFGAGRKLACLTARDQGRLVGILPFAIDRVGITRVARLAGTDPNCIVFRLPVEPEHLPAVLQAALSGLLTEGRADIVSFTPVSELSDIGAAVRSAAGQRDLALSDTAFASHVVFDLPDSFDGFLAALSKKRRAQFRRDLKGLEAEFGMEAVSEPASRDAFDRFVTFHNAQWQAVDKGGHFSDWPSSTAFYGDLAARSSTPIRFYSQAGRDGMLATQMSLISGQTCHWRLPARTLDPQAERLSVGKVGLLLMIRDLIAAGITRIEAGIGEYGYKLSYGGRDVPVSRVIVARKGAVAWLQRGLVLGWSDLLDLAYYRIWFKKLGPRWRALTGAGHRPLWRSWIRSRV